MSTLKVEVKAIDEIIPHPNADKLELARFSGWTCVVGKGVYKAWLALLHGRRYYV